MDTQYNMGIWATGYWSPSCIHISCLICHFTQSVSLVFNHVNFIDFHKIMALKYQYSVWLNSRWNYRPYTQHLFPRCYECGKRVTNFSTGCVTKLLSLIWWLHMMDADVKLLITMRHLLHICRTFVCQMLQ